MSWTVRSLLHYTCFTGKGTLWAFIESIEVWPSLFSQCQALGMYHYDRTNTVHSGVQTPSHPHLVCTFWHKSGLVCPVNTQHQECVIKVGQGKHSCALKHTKHHSTHSMSMLCTQVSGLVCPVNIQHQECVIMVGQIRLYTQTYKTPCNPLNMYALYTTLA